MCASMHAYEKPSLPILFSLVKIRKKASLCDVYVDFGNMEVPL